MGLAMHDAPERAAAPSDALVLFGVTGDLAYKKISPVAWATGAQSGLQWRTWMHRRFFWTAVRSLALAGLVWATLPGAQAQPRYTVSAEQLQQAVAQRFPLRYPVAGLLNLDLQAPRLRLLPEQNRLSAEMAVEAAGPALERSHAGTFEMDFALRYEASDRTIRAYQLRFKRLRFADLQPAASELLNTYGPALTEQSLHEVVVHQLRPQDLALADTMGLQPGSITVTDKGLVIGFVVKPL